MCIILRKSTSFKLRTINEIYEKKIFEKFCNMDSLYLEIFFRAWIYASYSQMQLLKSSHTFCTKIVTTKVV